MRFIPCLAALVAALALVESPVRAAEPGDPAQGDTDDGWHLTLTPYLWATSIKGDIGVKTLTAPVDASFSDLLSNLQLAGMLQFEAKKGRWAILLDGIGMKLNDDNITDPFLTVIDATIDMSILDVCGVYRVLDHDRGYVDLLAGARYVQVGLDLDGTPDAESIDAASAAVAAQAVDAIETQVGKAVSDKADDIAGKLAGTRGDIGKAAADLIKEEVKPPLENYVDSLAGEMGASLAAGVNVVPPQAQLGDELVSAMANRVQQEINKQPIANRHDPASIEKIIKQAAQSAIEDLKKSASSSVRKALEQAEQQIRAAVRDGMTAAADTSASADRDWVDPYVGARARWDLTPRFYLVARGDIGGFDVGSHLTWQLFGGVGTHLTAHTTLEAGYRHLYVDYGRDDFLIDTAFSGATVGVGFEL